MVYHQNIRGLLNKTEELINYLSPYFPQVLLLNVISQPLKLILHIWIDINLALNFAGNLSRMV